MEDPTRRRMQEVIRDLQYLHLKNAQGQPVPCALGPETCAFCAVIAYFQRQLEESRIQEEPFHV